jgi:preprotein translocase subunit SecE
MAKEGKKTMSDRIKGLKTEWSRITFLGRNTVIRQTTATVIVSLVLGLVIAVLDMLFKHGVDILVNL